MRSSVRSRLAPPYFRSVTAAVSLITCLHRNDFAGRELFLAWNSSGVSGGCSFLRGASVVNSPSLLPTNIQRKLYQSSAAALVTSILESNVTTVRLRDLPTECEPYARTSFFCCKEGNEEVGRVSDSAALVDNAHVQRIRRNIPLEAHGSAGFSGGLDCISKHVYEELFQLVAVAFNEYLRPVYYIHQCASVERCDPAQKRPD